MKENPFRYPMKGPGRPQILLMGNGLEYESHQKSWEGLLEQLAHPDAVAPGDKRCADIPFPLRYQLITTPLPAKAYLSAEELSAQSRHLGQVMGTLKHTTNQYLDMLPGLGADHIMSTNYSYCLEAAFFPGEDFRNPGKRSKHRCYLADREDGKPLMERHYRLHTCYLARSGDRNTGIWHIHGECSAAHGIILSHDRYGRLLKRIVDACGEQYAVQSGGLRQYTSWPELFLLGDVYVLGLGLTFHEFDLWWLIHRKQRERYGDGRIFFYERRPQKGYEGKHLLMQANGVVLCDAGCDDSVDYDTFYRAALAEIREKIAASRKPVT